MAYLAVPGSDVVTGTTGGKGAGFRLRVSEGFVSGYGFGKTFERRGRRGCAEDAEELSRAAVNLTIGNWVCCFYSLVFAAVAVVVAFCIPGSVL
jgi:hypothetical protein